MSNSNESPISQPDAIRVDLPEYRYVSAEEFAASTGANEGFAPAHLREWMDFWHHDVCGRKSFFGTSRVRSLPEARRVWLAMETAFFPNYDSILRVWPDWCSSGIWVPPYPGSLASGGMLDYQYLPLPEELVERFKAWQADYDNSPPGGPVDLDDEHFHATADELARDLKRHVGSRVYVEREELLEVLMDGTTRSWRPRLGLTESE